MPLLDLVIPEPVLRRAHVDPELFGATQTAGPSGVAASADNLSSLHPLRREPRAPPRGVTLYAWTSDSRRHLRWPPIQIRLCRASRRWQRAGDVRFPDLWLLRSRHRPHLFSAGQRFRWAHALPDDLRSGFPDASARRYR